MAHNKISERTPTSSARSSFLSDEDYHQKEEDDDEILSLSSNYRLTVGSERVRGAKSFSASHRRFQDTDIADHSPPLSPDGGVSRNLSFSASTTSRNHSTRRRGASAGNGQLRYRQLVNERFDSRDEDCSGVEDTDSKSEKSHVGLVRSSKRPSDSDSHSIPPGSYNAAPFSSSVQLVALGHHQGTLVGSSSHHIQGGANPVADITGSRAQSEMLETQNLPGDYRAVDSENSDLLRTEGFQNYRSTCCGRCFTRIRSILCGVRPTFELRLVHLGGATRPADFVPNVVCNRKYNLFTFVPLVLFQQFRFFFNLFYLGVSLLQLVPILNTGPIFTYLAPLGFVLFVTMSKEAIDDYKRYLRDREANNELFEVLTPEGEVRIPSHRIRVGTIVKLHANQRVPCDLVFLKTSDKSGTAFLRTDQLDGETDWKIRRPVAVTQQVIDPERMFSLDAVLTVEAPRREIYDFLGKFSLVEDPSSLYHSNSMTRQASFTIGRRESALEEGKARQVPLTGLSTASSADHHHRGDTDDVHVEPLTLENTMWANTVVASGPVWGMAVYTGQETRATMNTNKSTSKMGLFDLEVNFLSKVLFWMLLCVSAILISLKGFQGLWPVYFVRFMLILSSILPISLRVNLDMAKSFYSYLIAHDSKIPQTVLRTSTIPEELGRVDYLLTDKTGTLTQNDMAFKHLIIDRAQFSANDIDKARKALSLDFEEFMQMDSSGSDSASAWDAMCPSQPSREAMKMYRTGGGGNGEFSVPQASSEAFSVCGNRSIDSLLRQCVVALSICHNVTPVIDSETGEESFQAASPDEVALVKFASASGVKLTHRDEHIISIQVPPAGQTVTFEILSCFPFSSETKRMGVIVKDPRSHRIHFILKGAESIMIPLLQPRRSHWVQEECGNLATDGLRTLIIATRELSVDEFASFNRRYKEAKAAMTDRARKMRAVVESLEVKMDLLGLTGVEDKLQHDVPATLSSLRHAGVKIWMLTGDKVETATCIAISAELKAPHHAIAYLTSDKIKTPLQASDELEQYAMGLASTILVVDGTVLAIYLKHCPRAFVEVACSAPGVMCCRCSPTQKAEVVKLIGKLTGRRTCAIGDGGNDVSMILASSIGVGIVGKEGKQASMAADVSIQQFHYIRRLLLWHGRNSYQRSAKLAQFIVHRGMIIAAMQTIFSAIFYFIPIGIFQGWLTVGYATYYTMWPVFSLVLDVELAEAVVFMFPELYQTLKSGRSMSIKTFFGWVWKSVYQGAVILMGAIVLFEDRFINIVSISFTSLILSELLNVASEITTWRGLIVLAELMSICIYFASMLLLKTYFDITFIVTPTFWWKVAAITLLSWLPIHIFKVVKKKLKPPQYAKLAGWDRTAEAK